MSTPFNASEPSLPRLSAMQRLGRLRRMTVKELREILRDRRTIITLVLMPLLLYPLLSLACRQILFAEALSTRPVRYLIVVGTSVEEVLVERLLRLGADVLEREDENDATVERDYQLMVTPANVTLDSAVRSGEVDLAVRVPGAEAALFSSDDDVAIDCELIYNADSVLGQQAADFVERRFAAANRAILTRRLAELGVTQRPTPIDAVRRPLDEREATMAVSIVSIIPLILILMTITGAVYPAIDLTAGERERGTLETLVAAPVPRLSLLIAKYIAVWVVACLTAMANLLMLAVTISISGLGPLLFGERGLESDVVAKVFLLLLLFAAFFSAVLLTISSFARSFKEAQAYLIPLMLFSIAPGLLSLMPSMRLDNGMIAITPLLNLALLARGLFQGSTPVLATTIVVVSTVLYALAAIALAARVFGAEAVLYSSSNWSSLFVRSKQPQAHAPLSTAMFLLAILFPLQFIAVNTIAGVAHLDLTWRLAASGVATALLFAFVPLIAAWHGRIRPSTGLYLRRPRVLDLILAIVLGGALWPIAHEMVSLQHDWGFFTLTDQQIESVLRFVQQLQKVDATWVLLAIAVAPAVCEELFFRGYLLASLRSNMSDAAAIVTSGALFGLFHLIAVNSLSIERLAPTVFLGLVLGWLCVRTGSILPGMALHATHNGLIMMAAHRMDRLREVSSEAGADAELPPSMAHLPASWIAASLLTVTIVATLIFFVTRRREKSDDQVDEAVESADSPDVG